MTNIVMPPRVDAWLALVDVRYWPLADIPSCTAHVRFWG